MFNFNSNLIHLPYDLHTWHLGDKIAVVEVKSYKPLFGKWVSLDITNQSNWAESIHGKLSALKPADEEEILDILGKSYQDFNVGPMHTFRSGKTKITLIPSPFKEHEVYVFDHTRQTWVAFCHGSG